MSEHRLPGGGKAWFVRTRSRTSYKINPCSAEGWWGLIGYTVLMTVSPLAILLMGPQPPSTVHWIIWAVLLLAMTAIFLVLAFRMSAPLEDKENGR
ncbi:hypothetical protein IAG41_20710 [Sphingomonas sp. JC676]|uniref:hypothetical protein n=1 Tax=Sphingomonas sp. JC676 TaxID=2768065 RepID=UPI001657AB22|nr:hypothetical protein [Sphingomonas sp. JC676]MBC9034820.1 hypothetical protein [Sphingomonas sp. JC676]